MALGFFYWIVAGFATWHISKSRDGLDFILCLLLGGFLVPARLISKALR